MLLYAIVTWEYAENKKWSKTVHFFWSSKIRTSWINSSTPVCFSWGCLCGHLGRKVPHRQGHSHGCGFPFVCSSEGQQKKDGLKMEERSSNHHGDHYQTSDSHAAWAQTSRTKLLKKSQKFKRHASVGSMVNSLLKSMTTINAIVGAWKPYILQQNIQTYKMIRFDWRILGWTCCK